MPEPFAGAPQRLTNALNPKIHREDLVVPDTRAVPVLRQRRVPGLLYRPHQASADNKAPALVLVHGGPGGQAQVGYFALTQALVNHGYVVYDINNRGSSGYGKTFFAMDDRKHGEADLGDVVASKAMLVGHRLRRSDESASSGKLRRLHGSRGANTQPDAFRVGVDLFGISNWVANTLEHTGVVGGGPRRALRGARRPEDRRGAPATDLTAVSTRSKIKAADGAAGANDPRVLKVESDEIVAAAKKNGVPVEYSCSRRRHGS